MRYLICISLLFLTACHSTVERYPAPENLLSKEKMIALMTDLMKVEGHIQIRDISVSKYYKTAEKSGNRIFKQHQVTVSQFEEAMKYYGSRQAEMEEIYNEILNILNDELAELPVSPSASKDSIPPKTTL